MPISLPSVLRWLLPAVLTAVPLLIPAAGHAQVFGPPSTIVGSISDSGGPVAVGTKVEAYVGDTLCVSRAGSVVIYAGVPAYSVDVNSKEQTPGCGFDGATVRIKVGDRFAPQTAKWNTGYVPLNIAFGDATPVALPTNTPVPTSTPRPAGQTPVARPTGAAGASAAGGTAQPQGSASAGTPVTGQANGTPGVPAAGASPIAGGLNASPVAAGLPSESDDGGFPVWGVILVVLAVVGLIGGGAGVVLARSRRTAAGDSNLSSPDE